MSYESNPPQLSPSLWSPTTASERRAAFAAAASLLQRRKSAKKSVTTVTRRSSSSNSLIFEAMGSLSVEELPDVFEEQEEEQQQQQQHPSLAKPFRVAAAAKSAFQQSLGGSTIKDDFSLRSLVGTGQDWSPRTSALRREGAASPDSGSGSLVHYDNDLVRRDSFDEILDLRPNRRCSKDLSDAIRRLSHSLGSMGSWDYTVELECLSGPSGER